jgi:hypothetical protein
MMVMYEGAIRSTRMEICIVVDGGFMATAPEPHEEHEELVKVFDTEQESEAMVVQGLLEAEGIESVLLSLDAPQEVLPGVGGVILQVHKDQAERALQLIEDYRNNASADPELTEEASQPE